MPRTSNVNVINLNRVIDAAVLRETEDIDEVFDFASYFGREDAEDEGSDFDG